ncbi:transposase [Chloroflexota bacterium]
MKGIPQGRYTKEFRQEVVKLIMEEKLSFPEAGRRLSLAPSTLSYWVKAYSAGKLGEISKTKLNIAAKVPLCRVNQFWLKSRKQANCSNQGAVCFLA